jgi:hypothetical protein
MRRIAVLALCWLPTAAFGHVGVSDIVYEGQAGPYGLVVSIAPPEVIPGVAQVEIETNARDLAELKVLAMPLSGDGARLPPTPDIAQRFAGTPVRFSARLWLMSAGAWQVHLAADGGRGTGALAIPVPALPSRTKSMGWPLGLTLAALTVFLVLGAASIIGAGTAEGQLSPGEAPDPKRVRKAWWTRTITAVLLALGLIGANQWWSSEAEDYRRNIYKPIQMTAAVIDGELRLTMGDPGWLRARRTDDWIPDHGHLMHLYLVSEPGMERVWHLHPEPLAPDVFHHPLPPDLPGGRYRLFADVVHATGLAETATAELELPAGGGPLLPDDAAGAGPPVSDSDANRRGAPLSVGQMLWLNSGNLEAGRLLWLRFRVKDAPAQPTEQLEPYMGMLGHAAVIRDDGSVFAHIHPSGSVPMAALMLAAGQHSMDDPKPGFAPAEVGFPFRFPKAGLYRIVVQVKRRGIIESGLFTARVVPSAGAGP